jgi:hypothetical protein
MPQRLDLPRFQSDGFERSFTADSQGRLDGASGHFLQAHDDPLAILGGFTASTATVQGSTLRRDCSHGRSPGCAESIMTTGRT